MSKELTPMKELMKSFDEYEIDSRNDSITIEKLKEVITNEFLTKEKQVIEDAYEQGKIDEETIHPTYSDGKDYYNTKYNKQIK